MTAPRRERITLHFLVDIQKGSIRGDRTADACAAAIRALGVIEGEVLSGARFMMTHVKSTNPKTEQLKRQKRAAKLDQEKLPCPECDATHEDRLRLVLEDDGDENHNRCGTCGSLFDVRGVPEPITQGEIVKCDMCKKKHFLLNGVNPCANV